MSRHLSTIPGPTDQGSSGLGREADQAGSNQIKPVLKQTTPDYREAPRLLQPNMTHLATIGPVPRKKPTTAATPSSRSADMLQNTVQFIQARVANRHAALATPSMMNLDRGTE